jgi:hypothetical protein
MKFLILIIAIMIIAQPVQAGSCEADQGSSTEHSVMHEGGDSHQGPDNGSGHDCCDSDKVDPQQGCDHQLQCGLCTAGVLGFAVIPSSFFIPPVNYVSTLSSGMLAPSHSSPPFRPPIS